VLPRLTREAAPANVLDEAMNKKERALGIARHQRMGGEIVERLA